MNKPKIAWCKREQIFNCDSVEKTPGEICFINGKGETPFKAFKEWACLFRVYILSNNAKKLDSGGTGIKYETLSNR
ncbi:hypothetical protein [Dryocola sp. LX212]